MINLTPITIPDETGRQIESLIYRTGKPKEMVLRELLEAGLRSYPTTLSKSVKATLDLIAWAEKENITSEVTDLSINHNTYAWEE